MELLSTAIVSAVLLLLAAVMMVLHMRAWRRAKRHTTDVAELDYRGRQFRRRMQTSALLGILGLAIMFGSLIRGPWWFVAIFWVGVLLVLAWLALLALADVVATKLYFGRLHADYLAEQAKLQVQLRRAKRCRGNGQTGTD